jgi:hypothetical protein
MLLFERQGHGVRFLLREEIRILQCSETIIEAEVKWRLCLKLTNGNAPV